MRVLNLLKIVSLNKMIKIYNQHVPGKPIVSCKDTAATAYLKSDWSLLFTFVDKKTNNSNCLRSSVASGQTAVTVHLASKQPLLFVFARQVLSLVPC